MIDAERFKRLADAAADGLKEREEIVTTVEYEVPKIDTSARRRLPG